MYMGPTLFDRCMIVIFEHEGGYVNHPNDPGGETNYGIAKKFFPDEDIKNLTKDRAKQLYFENYWLPMNLKDITDDLAVLHLFDMGVNAGRSRAVKMAQGILNLVQDGLVGPITTMAINNEPAFVQQYIYKRKEYYRNLAHRKPKLKVFLKGWLNRVDNTNF